MSNFRSLYLWNPLSFHLIYRLIVNLRNLTSRKYFKFHYIFSFIETRFLQLHCNISISFLILAIILICKNNEKKAQLVQLQLKQLHKRFSSKHTFYFTCTTPLIHAKAPAVFSTTDFTP